MRFTKDAPYKATRAEKSGYEKVRRAELQYGNRLRRLARMVGHIVEGFKPGDPQTVRTITRLLEQYATFIQPWAEATARAMVADVYYRDTKNWDALTKNMGQALRDELKKAPTGEAMRMMMGEQVALITSIPLEAAQRVHKLTMEGLINAERYDDIKRDLMRTTKVTESRATLIARTEVGRVATSLAQSRAAFVGSEGYIWRTAKDADVRPSHRRLEGKFIRWDSPPLCDAPNFHAHAGAIFNCRCYPEIVLPERYH